MIRSKWRYHYFFTFFRILNFFPLIALFAFIVTFTKGTIPSLYLRFPLKTILPQVCYFWSHSHLRPFPVDRAVNYQVPSPYPVFWILFVDLFLMGFIYIFDINVPHSSTLFYGIFEAFPPSLSKLSASNSKNILEFGLIFYLKVIWMLDAFVSKRLKGSYIV